LALDIELIGICADEIFPIGEAAGLVVCRTIGIVSIHVKSLIQPLVVEIGRHAVRIVKAPSTTRIASTLPSPIIASTFLFATCDTGHGEIRLIYIVGHREYRNP